MSVWGSNNISADDISADDTELAQKAENRQAVVKSFSYSAANFGAITSARLPKILSVENPNLLEVSFVSPGRQNIAFYVSPAVENSVIL